MQPPHSHPEGYSLPEDVQLNLAVGGGRLRQGDMEVAAAALIDLALRGRVGSVPGQGFFARGVAPRLVVIDSTPTGDAALDSALSLLISRGKPCGARRCLKAIRKPVSAAVQDGLIRRGVVSRAGKFANTADHLTIEDESVHRAAVYRLDTAWLNPDAVVEPRSGALVDLMRNAGDQFNRRRALEPTIKWEWYPADVRSTVLAILNEEKLATGSSSGTGYEG